MKFATYTRKSIYSDKSDSTGNQQRMCKEYVDFKFKNDVESFSIYEDEGFTGANTKRPELQRLIKDVEANKIDALVVYQLDRLSRDIKDFANIYSVLEEYNVMFISIKENIDTTTPIGRAMMYITTIFAQLERETIAERVTDNMIGLAKRGFWTGGNPPYGYKREHVAVNGKKHCIIVPVPEAVEYIKSIYLDFLENHHSLQGMETTYKHQGKRTINGAFFSTTQLHKILTMPYCVPATGEVWDFYNNLGCKMIDERNTWNGEHGVMIYGRSTEKKKKHQLQPPSEWLVCQGIHEPFVDASIWLKVQDKFYKNKFNKTSRYDKPLLKGVLRCAKCGNLMQVSRKKLAHGNILSHYYCRKRMREGVEVCDTSMIKCDTLDEKVIEIFKGIEADPKTIKDYCKAYNMPSNSARKDELEHEARNIRLRIKRLTESLAEGENVARYILKQIEAEDLSLQAVERELEQLQDVESTFDVNDNIKAIENMIHSFDKLSADEKNAIAIEVIKKATWDGESLNILL